MGDILVRWFHHWYRLSRQGQGRGYSRSSRSSSSVPIKTLTQEEEDQIWRNFKSFIIKFYGLSVIFFGILWFFYDTVGGLSLALIGIFILDYSKGVKYKIKKRGALGRLFGIILLISGVGGLIMPENSDIGSIFCIMTGLLLLGRYYGTKSYPKSQ